MAFAPIGHGLNPRLLDDPVISAISVRLAKTPAQVLLAWAVQRGTAVHTTPTTIARAHENFDITVLPQDAFDEINRITTRQRLNQVVKTGIPGFIPVEGRNSLQNCCESLLATSERAPLIPPDWCSFRVLVPAVKWQSVTGVPCVAEPWGAQVPVRPNLARNYAEVAP